ncbi:MAG TPA: helix-turn-helix domain-containing protein [Bryobacteraceae bacterium]|nr:helix-turn-helix domain-containing protein [Bryobacteraceae bacterium]
MKKRNFAPAVTKAVRHTLQFERGMEDLNENLTIKDVARLLRCSKTHVQNALRGKVPGMPPLTHLAIGRRKIIRRQWLNLWMERNKAS